MSAPSNTAEPQTTAEQQQQQHEGHTRHRRRRRRHGHGHGYGHDGAGAGAAGEDAAGGNDKDGGWATDEDGDGGSHDDGHDSPLPPQAPAPAPAPTAPSASPSTSAPAAAAAASTTAASPLRPLRIDPTPGSPLSPGRSPLRVDSPNLRRARESGSLTPGRSPSRRRHDRRVKAAAVKAGRTRKRVLITIFLLGAVLGAYFIPRLFPRMYLPWMIALPAFNVSAVLPGGLADVNSTILNDVWGIFQSAVSPETYPGLEARERGVKAHYPIVLVPGFVTTGLEVWEGEECASSLFRSRLWGTFTMLSTMIMKPDCWVKHMALDPETGLDPPGIRIRPAQGLEAADNFLGSWFWVWSRLIRDFAAIGYDHSNMILASYDWRLSLHDMERRDHYFTILKNRIETLVKINGGRKVVLIAHSYGSNVVVYFMKWVESKQGGKGGNGWVANHLHSFVNVAGPLLGVIKSAASYVSGEMHDTAELGPLEGIMFGKENNAFYRLNRRRLFRTWGSLTAMLPKGGAALWGNLTHAPDDVDEEAAAAAAVAGADGACLPVPEDGAFVAPPEAAVGAEGGIRPVEGEEAPGELPRSSSEDIAAAGADGSCVTPGERQAEPIRYGQVIGFSEGRVGQERNWTVDDVIHHLQNDPDDPQIRRRLTEDYDFGYVADPRKLSSRAQDDRRLWTNPLAVALPKAPKLKVICYYGVGKPTERAYIYKRRAGDDGGAVDVIDTSINDPRRNISDGVLMGEGDGTVSLLSLGYHCTKLWREPTHNPSGMSVTSRELWHTTTGLLTLTRTGGASGDHVDVLGNTELASELLLLVSGHEDAPSEDRYFSRIREMADKVHLT